MQGNLPERPNLPQSSLRPGCTCQRRLQPSQVTGGNPRVMLLGRTPVKIIFKLVADVEGVLHLGAPGPSKDRSKLFPIGADFVPSRLGHASGTTPVEGELPFGCPTEGIGNHPFVLRSPSSSQNTYLEVMATNLFGLLPCLAILLKLLHDRCICTDILIIHCFLRWLLLQSRRARAG